MDQKYWIWYPGDFEIYHGMMQNFSREERGFFWPAYWYIDDCRKNVKFIKEYYLEERETFTVYSNSMGYAAVNGEKRCFGEEILCGPGKVKIEIFAGSPTGVPAVFVDGKRIFSNESWLVSDMTAEKCVKAGCSSRYTRKEQNPSLWEYETKECMPAEIVETEKGLLFDFGTELMAELEISFPKGFRQIQLCYGESVTEAMDVNMCYYGQKLQKEADTIPKRAFRYVYIPEVKKEEVEVTAIHYYVDIPIRAEFSGKDPLLNQIWETAVRTFQLCSGIFFIDGVKRDRWIWSGDAYQSYFVNQYLMFDEDINKRTIWALRGNDPIRQHINTILDYSMYWVISILNHYEMTGDQEFVRAVYPKMKTMMDYLENQLDQHGFLVGRPEDWIFVDWADIDKSGPVCAEQMLLARCYKTMARANKIMDSQEGNYEEKYAGLLKQIDTYYWDETHHAYIDSFVSGKRQVTRHANIFAVLFGIAEEERAEEIFQNVIENPAIPPITTPYFKFYELEMLAKMGRHKEVLEEIRVYWGGMLKEGAVTFWEEYDPKQKGDAHYEMYGDPYGKSLCHGWAASPIYLIGRYFMGIRPTKAGYAAFEVCPDVSLFDDFQCTFPVKDGQVSIKWDQQRLSVWTDREGGVLRFQGERIELKRGEECVLSRH